MVEERSSCYGNVGPHVSCVLHVKAALGEKEIEDRRIRNEMGGRQRESRIQSA